MSAPPLPDRELDCRGLLCPIPVTKAKKALSEMAAGEVLKIVATDPVATLDFRVYSELSGNELLHREEEDGVFTFYVLVAPGPVPGV